MKDNALYYPYINLPESDWLMKRLLYWDKMYSIATYETIHNKKDLTPLMQELSEDDNLFQFIKPLDYYHKLENFRNSFLETAKDFQFNNPYQNENMTRIHIEKISDLSNQLENMGVKTKLGRGIGFTDVEGVYFKGSDINRKYSLKGIEELLSYKHQEKETYKPNSRLKI